MTLGYLHAQCVILSFLSTYNMYCCVLTKFYSRFTFFYLSPIFVIFLMRGFILGRLCWHDHWFSLKETRRNNNLRRLYLLNRKRDTRCLVVCRSQIDFPMVRMVDCGRVLSAKVIVGEEGVSKHPLET